MNTNLTPKDLTTLSNAIEHMSVSVKEMVKVTEQLVSILDGDLKQQPLKITVKDKPAHHLPPAETTNINDLGLSDRVLNPLYRAGIRNVSEAITILSMGPTTLSTNRRRLWKAYPNLRNWGVTAENELRAALLKKGYLNDLILP